HLRRALPPYFLRTVHALRERHGRVDLPEAAGRSRNALAEDEEFQLTSVDLSMEKGKAENPFLVRLSCHIQWQESEVNSERNHQCTASGRGPRRRRGRQVRPRGRDCGDPDR